MSIKGIFVTYVRKEYIEIKKGISKPINKLLFNFRLCGFDSSLTTYSMPSVSELHILKLRRWLRLNSFFFKLPTLKLVILNNQMMLLRYFNDYKQSVAIKKTNFAPYWPRKTLFLNKISKIRGKMPAFRICIKKIFRVIAHKLFKMFIRIKISNILEIEFCNIEKYDFIFFNSDFLI